jgi:hypothetical protein
MTNGAFLEIRLAGLYIGARRGASRDERQQNTQAEV